MFGPLMTSFPVVELRDFLSGDFFLSFFFNLSPLQSLPKSCGLLRVCVLEAGSDVTAYLQVQARPVFCRLGTVTTFILTAGGTPTLYCTAGPQHHLPLRHFHRQGAMCPTFQEESATAPSHPWKT